MMKKTLYFSYVLTMAVMAAATAIGTCQGQSAAVHHVYGSGWFVCLWALLTLVSVLWLMRHKPHRWSVWALHAALLLILAGALVTRLTAATGTVHLREGEMTEEWVVTGADGHATMRKLPFGLRLDQFSVQYDAGTQTPADYTSVVTVTEGDGHFRATVSMNHILCHRGLRLYQSGYDEDGHGTTLAINADPWGTPITYAGYALLFMALIALLADPHGGFRTALRSDTLRRCLGGVAIGLGLATPLQAAPTLPRETAERMGQLYVLSGDRICTLQSYATAFIRKLCGDTSYRGLTATQVLCGWIFWGDDWATEQCIRLRGKELGNRLLLPNPISLNGFFGYPSRNYVLGPYVNRYWQGDHSACCRQANDMDERLQLVFDLRKGKPLKMFPHTHGGQTVWLSPSDSLPHSLPTADSLYIRGAFTLLYQYAKVHAYAEMDSMITKMHRYQQLHAAGSLPPATRTWAERAYLQADITGWLYKGCLAVGMALLIASIIGLGRGRRRHRGFPVVWTLGLLAWMALTAVLVLRWMASGTVPLANGYETMMVLAWASLLTAIVTSWHWRIMLPFGLVVSGFFLLVSHMAEADPTITPTMPVLRSPLLSLHVSVIMLAYALLSLTFVCSLTALVSRRETAAPLMLLGRVMLYPAVALLAIGIFIGAVWANISWGCYWNWDPKEVWALITLMVYAIPLHGRSVPALQRPLLFHLFVCGAFASLLMTYFGVNYLMGGMHSYYG